jgi:hypothetical protein
VKRGIARLSHVERGFDAMFKNVPVHPFPTCKHQPMEKNGIAEFKPLHVFSPERQLQVDFAHRLTRPVIR